MTRYSELLCLLALMTINTHATPASHKRVPTADTPTLSFPCTGNKDGDMTEVCKTMCYGINCMNLPSAMWWDKRTSEEGPEALAVAEARSKAAGCQINNRCSKPPYEKVWECDEFPFKTTDPARMMQPAGAVPINRCVPRIQNKLKIDVLKDFYKSPDGRNGEEGWFKLSFQNYAGITYCEDAAKKCVNDGNVYTKSGPASPPGPQTVSPPHRYYLTKRGVNLFIPAGAEIGDAVRSHGEDGSVEMDEIVALANATSIAE